MTVRVILVSPAHSVALERSAFDDGLPLTERGRAAAAAARFAGLVHPPRRGRVLLSPSVRCHETAEALGLDGSPDVSFAGQSVGDWRGRALDELTATEPEAVRRWLEDPGYVPPGGEPLDALIRRVGAGLTGLAAGEEATAGRRHVLVVEPDAVRAAVVHALRLPAAAFWRLDVRPLSVTDLSGRSGRWNLRLGNAED
ncbi:histidine phosphatase family protein [Streptomyces sp. NPDC049954]|uniref:histidine phosphatase family protein n=1 Tax=Streptomyces sp. NPDC049954 TaxID=3155779 RepID=UPI0034485522